ncbi:uncharacterized protein LOC120353523 [Nilaparvata lugens]|uniref:uncharacterized protein LOC120353523 n=1 Tax=Nilaparvata lugens TaxID=108931 RepID=UPI00193DC99A|nr:uncharacterized protein LOC120353523 [Nilaparvata lugens]
MLQVFVNRCLRRIMGIRWPEVISNEALWESTCQDPIQMQIKRRKWRWIGHTLRKEEGAIEKDALDWNPQGHRARGRPKITWKRTIQTEIGRAGKTWLEVKALARDRVGWRTFSEALCSSRSDRN